MQVSCPFRRKRKRRGEPGSRVEAVYRVEVGRLNPGRIPGGDPLEMLVLGDHLEALEAVIAERGIRGGYHDGGRRRSVVR